MVVGILGGSGLYDLPDLSDRREEPLTTPFGEPSAAPVSGTLGRARVVFLPRHGRGHRLLPSEIDYRANIHALKQLGVERVISVSAVGSLRDDIHPGDVVLVDQFVDRTIRRTSTFFGDGVAGHVSFADPVCPLMMDALAAGARAAGSTRPVHRGGTYVCMEGPQFSTRAESQLHRSWGAHVIGMTAATEAKLCREAEMCFAVLALATDYDAWHPEEAAVTAGGVVEMLHANIERARGIVGAALQALPDARACACASAARHAILTDRAAIPADARQRLHVLFGRYL